VEGELCTRVLLTYCFNGEGVEGASLPWENQKQPGRYLGTVLGNVGGGRRGPWLNSASLAVSSRFFRGVWIVSQDLCGVLLGGGLRMKLDVEGISWLTAVLVQGFPKGRNYDVGEIRGCLPGFPKL
jgi:hypothetical protein